MACLLRLRDREATITIPTPREHIIVTIDRRRWLLACAAAALPSLPFGARASAPPLQPQDFHADLDTLCRGIEGLHPALAHSVEPAALQRATAALAASVTQALTQDEAWQRLSTLNPLLADGHLLIGYANWRAMARDHVAAGGGFFPFEVSVAPSGELLALSPLGQAPDSAVRTIERINGELAADVVASLMQHVHGDTAVFRAGLLSSRWWFYHWKLRGAAEQYELELTHAGRRETVKLPAARTLPLTIIEEAAFEQQFSLRQLADDTAVLRLASFSTADKPRFLRFTAQAFATLRAQRVRRLLIDVRANGGGDDDLWIDGVMPYLATRRYRIGSHYQKRVLQPDPAKGEKAGDVVAGEIDRWFEPDTTHADRFGGDICVLAGRDTYSSAVLFCNVMQDFGFATLAGVGGAVRAQQSGGVRSIDLPRSGLRAWCPRFVLDPPTGDAARWLTPDWPLPDDPTQPDAMLQLASQRLRHRSRPAATSGASAAAQT